MITKLKRRPRSDSFDREAARPRRRWDRAIYLTMLFAFGVAIMDYVAGDLVFLRADGLVLRERNVIAATTLVRIDSIQVTAGQTVSRDELLLNAPSYEVLDRLAELSMREAELAEREADLRSQKRLAERLVPLANARLAELREISDSMIVSQASGLVTATRGEEAFERAHEAEVEFVTFSVQIEGLDAELDALTDARDQARAARNDLTAHYSAGQYRAGTPGVVGDIVPAPGEVFNPGEPILTVLSGRPYVLAYLPANYLFKIRPGDRIVVSAGQSRQYGRIDRILPVSQSIPDEFRNAFRVDERRQLARIALEGSNMFPTFSAVRVARDGPWIHLGDVLRSTVSSLRRPTPIPETNSGTFATSAAD